MSFTQTIKAKASRFARRFTLLHGNDTCGLESVLSDIPSNLQIVRSPALKRVNVETWFVKPNAASSDEPASLGKPKSLDRFLVMGIRPPEWASHNRQIPPAWLCPEGGSASSMNTENGIMLAYRQLDGKHVVIMAVHRKRATFVEFDDTTTIRVRAERKEANADFHEVLVGVGSEVETIVAALMNLVRTSLEMSPLEVDEDVLYDGGAKASVDDEIWMNGACYCTWDSLGADLSEEKIFNALEDLHNKDLAISTLVIDDAWQSTRPGTNTAALEDKWKPKSHQMYRFEARESFPNGLKHTILEIKRRYPSIKNVIMWHALFGYWGGISPNSELAEKYPCVDLALIDGCPWGTDRTIVASEHTERFYRDFYSFLKDCGVDGVKVDQMIGIHQFKPIPPSSPHANIAKATYDAVQKSCAEIFDNKIIYSMAHSPLVVRLLFKRLSKKNMFRNSHDYYPHFAESHLWHIYMNWMNTILTRHLEATLDFDMFQSGGPLASLHALTRTLSSGPILMSDKPGQQDLALLSKMFVKSPQGHDIALRLKAPSSPVDPYHKFGAENSFNVISKETNFTLLAVMNLSTVLITETYPDIAKMTSLNHVVRGCKSGMVFPAIESDSHKLQFETGEWELFTAVPLTAIGQVEVGVFGLINALIGVVAVESVKIEEKSVDITLEALGQLGVYLKSLGDKRNAVYNFRLEGQILDRKYINREDNMYTIDVATAWKDLAIAPRDRATVKITWLSGI